MSEQMKTVLIVDDTETNIDILVAILGGIYEVSVALNGESTLEYLEEDLPDCILLDVKMPGIDGFEVCKRIKKWERTKNIPVIFISAMTDENEKEEGLNLGALSFISKPINPEEVLSAIKGALS